MIKTGFIIKNLCKKFKIEDDEHIVFSDISLEIPGDKITVILGESGCGKTTILRIIAGFEEPSHGQVMFNGEDIAKVPAYKREVNTVFQKYALFPFLNVHDNVAFGLNLKKKDKKEIDEKVTKMLALVGLAGFGNRDITSLSGGQQQRVAIARALALQPDILCFDEPTSALDPELTGEVLKVIKGLAEEKTTMVIVTHEMAFARDVADTVVFMDKGVIVEQGDAKEVINNPKEERTKQFLSRYSQG